MFSGKTHSKATSNSYLDRLPEGIVTAISGISGSMASPCFASFVRPFCDVWEKCDSGDDLLRDVCSSDLKISWSLFATLDVTLVLDTAYAEWIDR